MNRRWTTVAALFAAAMLQIAMAPHLAIAGVVPNLLLLVVVTLALVQGPAAGCTAGFAAGLTLDLLGTGPIGSWALVLCVMGYLAGTLHANLFAEGWLLPVSVVLVASLVAEMSYGFVLRILGEGPVFGAAFVRLMLPGAVYDTALAVFVYPWLTKVLKSDRPMKTFRRLA